MNGLHGFYQMTHPSVPRERNIQFPFNTGMINESGGNYNKVDWMKLLMSSPQYKSELFDYMGWTEPMREGPFSDYTNTAASHASMRGLMNMAPSAYGGM